MSKLTHIFSTIAIACLLSGAMLTQLTAQEQTTPQGQPDPKEYKMPGMMKLPTFIDCGPYDAILGIVQGQYGEIPFAIFESKSSALTSGSQYGYFVKVNKFCPDT